MIGLGIAGSALLASVIGPTPETSQIQVRAMDWDAMPPASIRAGPVDGSGARTELRRIIQTRVCHLPGSTTESFNLSVRYGVQLTPSGDVLAIRVEPRNCRPLEALVAAMVRKIGADRDFRAPGGEAPRWFTGRIIFNN